MTRNPRQPLTGGRGPKKIGDIVSNLLARKGYARVQAASACEEAWKEAAGKLAAHSRPGLVKRGVLEVIFRNSAALQELTFQKKKLLKQLQQQLPEEQLTDVRFRIGSLD
jgi:predicted nucleic acid-binding Zn ribbon protein